MRELDKEGRSPRYIAFISLVTLVFLIFIGRLFAIQILEASKYEERALQNRIRTNVIKANRIVILYQVCFTLQKYDTGRGKALK